LRRAFDGSALATDVQPFASEPNDDRNECLEGCEILIVLPAKAQWIGEPLEGEGRFGDDCSQ